MKGVIFNIKRYAIHDGPGIRVTFFMKGCALRCRWCHNPEGISPEIEFVDRTDRIGDREFVTKETVGREYSLDELTEIVRKEYVFIEESGGGVTFSGGEPLMQPDFVLAALRHFSNMGIHTCLDTSGFAPASVIDDALKTCDMFLFDIKHVDSDTHRKYTGVKNELILSNYRRILDSGKDVIIRIPVIPGFNYDMAHMEKVRNLLSDNDNIKRIDLLPYHKIGSSKYRKFDLDYLMEGVEPPSDSEMSKLKGFFSEPGFKVKIGG